MSKRKYLLLCLYSLLCFSNIAADVIYIDDGVLNLNALSSTPISPLTGKWQFQDEKGNQTFLDVPGSWNTAAGYVYGQGSYSFQVEYPEGTSGMDAIIIPRLVQDVKLYINDRLIYDSAPPDSPSRRLSRIVLPITKSEVMNFVIELNNDIYRKGGLNRIPIYGAYDLVMNYWNKSLVIDSIETGFFLLLFIYNLYLFLARYFDRSTLYLSCSSLFFALRSIFTGNIIIQSVFPALPWQASYRANYPLLYLGVVCLILFFNAAYPPQRQVRIIYSRVMIAAGLLFALGSVFIPIRLLSHSVYLLQFYSLVSLLSCLLFLFPFIRKRTRSIPILLTAGLIFLGFASIDIYLINMNGLSYNLTQKGLLVFLLANFLIITTQFGEAFKKTKILSHELTQEVSRQTAELTKLSRTDPLTGVDNRRWFMDQGEREIELHKREARSLSLLMLDIDHFKKVNDKFGHSCGDKALIYMTKLCHEEIRATDILGRLGGEEFAIILLNTDCTAAVNKANAIRRKLETSTLDRSDEIPAMTVSIGVININTEHSLGEALEKADAFLYKAKENGRNRVESEIEEG